MAIPLSFTWIQYSCVLWTVQTHLGGSAVDGVERCRGPSSSPGRRAGDGRWAGPTRVTGPGSRPGLPGAGHSTWERQPPVSHCIQPSFTSFAHSLKKSTLFYFCQMFKHIVISGGEWGKMARVGKTASDATTSIQETGATKGPKMISYEWRFLLLWD